MDQQFYSLVKKRISARQDIIAKTLVGGSISTMEEYKSFTGKLRGLDEAKDILRQAFKDFFNDGESNEEMEFE
jgi:hypothetical protein